MGLFSGKKQKAYKTFERLFKSVWRAKAAERAKAKDQILSPDLLRRRQQVTKGGRKELVLAYGTKGKTVSYTLDDLNKMAKAMDKAEKVYSEEARGVPIDQLIRASKIPVDIHGKRKGLSDYRKALNEIGTAVLYKIEENLLFFRVTASGRWRMHHYQVRIRLEDWRKQMREGGDTYIQAAKLACKGRVSFDCSCGRHQYWFRYLATIGGFGLDPAEHGFPKIRNPGLKGACCKHVVKVLAVLQSPAIHIRLSAEMERQAKKKGWFSKMIQGSGPKRKFLKDKDLAELEKAGRDVKIEKEFRRYTNARKAFNKKLADKETQKKVEDLRKAMVTAKAYKTVAEEEKKAREKLEKDLLQKDLEGFLFKAVYRDKKSKAQAVKSYAKGKGLPMKEVKELAANINL